MTDTVFLLDVDNTLLDNDAVIADLRRHLVEAFGPECDQRYWEIFEQLRTELGYADYLGALQRYRVEHPRETHVLQISLFLLHYPFAEPRLSRRARRHPRAARRAAAPSSSPTATSSFSRARSSARACGPRSTARCSSTFTRSRCSTTSSGAIRRGAT